MLSKCSMFFFYLFLIQLEMFRFMLESLLFYFFVEKTIAALSVERYGYQVCDAMVW